MLMVNWGQMKGSIFNSVGEFFALDIGSSAIRVVQLRGSQANKTLVRYGSVPIDAQTSLSDAPGDQVKVGQLVADLVSQVGITTTNVAVGLPSSKTFVTLVDMPKLSLQEMNSTIKYQADQFIPMAADEAKIDWAILGDSPVGQDKVEVLLASVTNKFSEQRMDLLESHGFNVIALEPDSLALARSLTPGTQSGAQMIVDMGEYATDVVITLKGTPRLVRSIPVGGQSLVKTTMQSLTIDENQARQLVYKFGLDQTKLEGQIFQALQSTVDLVTTEIQKSLKFFSSRYQNVQLEGIVTSGVAAVLPGFHQYLSTAAGNVPVQTGNSWQNVSYSNDGHEQLMAVNTQFAVAVGLAERGV